VYRFWDAEQRRHQARSDFPLSRKARTLHLSEQNWRSLRAVGNQTMQAGLPCTGVVEVPFAHIPFRHEALGDGGGSILSSDSPAFDLEASRRNPSLDEFAARVHCCGFVNVTAITD